MKRRSRSPWRGAPEQRRGSERSLSPEYKTTCLSRPSRSPSPKQLPLQPPLASQPEPSYYGTTQLERRSRSPSPTRSLPAQSFPLQRILAARFAASRLGSSGRRLPPVPSAFPCSRSPTRIVPGSVAGEAGGAGMSGYPVSEYEQRSRSPSPCSSVYSLSSYYRHADSAAAARLRYSSGGLRYPVTASAAVAAAAASTGTTSRIGHPIIAPFVMSLDQPILQHIRLPSVSNSPTIPRPDVTQSPNDINFPRVCASPSHAGPPAPLSQQQAAAPQTRLFA